MNYLLVLPEECHEENKAIIRGARAKYVLEFHDLAPGVAVAALVRGGQRGTATVIDINADEITLALSLKSDSPPKLKCDVIVGLCRPLTVRKVIQAIASLGGPTLHLVPSINGEKSYLSSKGLEPEAIELELTKAMEQCGDSIPPKILVHRSFGGFLEHERGKLCSDAYGIKILGSTDANASALKLQKTSTPNQTAVLAIGPEAGWSTGELDHFTRLGFELASLGPRILRVETALVAFLAQLQLVHPR